MKNKEIILSFDYELFFGYKSGTVLKSIIEPTNTMLNALDQINAKATYFVDYLMLKYISEVGDMDSYNLLVSQIKDMVARGHRIELHIHSHWIDAKYNNDGTWDFSDFTHYSLSSLSQDVVEDMFVEGVFMLNQIAQTVDLHYQVVAFRAGGWSILPFSHLRQAFLKSGLKIDSSVASGFHLVSDHSDIDFTSVPRESSYYFDTDVTVQSDKKTFLEVPITTYTFYTPFTKLYSKIHIKLHRGRYLSLTDGTHSRSLSGKDSDILSKVLKFIMPARRMYTLSLSVPCLVVAKMFFAKRRLMVFIDHPKDFAQSNIDVLHAISKYSNFITYNDLLKK